MVKYNKCRHERDQKAPYSQCLWPIDGECGNDGVIPFSETAGGRRLFINERTGYGQNGNVEKDKAFCADVVAIGIKIAFTIVGKPYAIDGNKHLFPP